MTSDRHEKWIELLPAHLLRRLDPAEDAELTAHLAQCVACRDELRLADRLQAYFTHQSQADVVLQQWLFKQQLQTQREAPAVDETRREQRNFERLWQRIETAAPTEKSSAASTIAATAMASYKKRAGYRWLPLAAALVMVVIVTVAGVAWRDQLLAPSYRTLASGDESMHCGALRVRFVDNLAASDLQNLLRSVDAQIIAGPTPHGVYTLRAQRPDAALQRLHLHPAVLLAEPTGC